MSIDETNAPLLDGDAASIMGILLAISMEHDGDPPGVEAPATPVLAMLEALEIWPETGFSRVVSYTWGQQG